MSRIFISPSRYVQGAGILKTELEYIKSLGTKALLLTDNIVWEILGEEFKNNLEALGIEVFHEAFNGEASPGEIERITQITNTRESDMIIGAGGGKTIDTAKAVADSTNNPVVIVPTIASTDAPTSALSVVYSDEGSFENYRFYDKNPELIMVDTQVIAQAPAQLLADGIADALATWVEARTASESYSPAMAGGQATITALAIAEKSVEVLFENAAQAMADNEAKVVTRAFEDVVEANTLMSGLGFESGGLAIAHAVHNGFTALEGDIHTISHGGKVAYGTLTQLYFENRPKEELDRYIHLYQSLDLPTTLDDLHIGDASREDLLKIGQQATAEGETVHGLAYEVTPESIQAALIGLNQYVKNLDN